MEQNTDITEQLLSRLAVKGREEDYGKRGDGKKE